MQSKGLSRVFSNTTVQNHQFFGAQLSSQSNSHIHTLTAGKTIALTRWTFVGKVISLLFNMLSRLSISFLPRSKCLLISWLQSPSAVIFRLKSINSRVHVFLSFTSCRGASEMQAVDALDRIEERALCKPHIWHNCICFGPFEAHNNGEQRIF